MSAVLYVVLLYRWSTKYLCLTFKIFNMADEKTYVFDGASSNNIPLAYALNNNGWGNNGFGLGGWGGGILGFLLGALFGGGFGGFGGYGGGFGNAGVGYLGNQMNNDNNTDLIMQAINGTDSDVRLLATTLNADVNEVRSAISALQLGIANVGSQVGLSSLQVQNAILSGDASIQAKLSECCCENRLLTTQQGYEAQLRTVEQTNQLGSQADRNTNSIIGAINAQTIAMNDQFCALKERELQNKIDSLTAANTTLKSQIDNANQTAAVAAMLAPIQKEVTEIKAAQPSTATVQYPQLTAIPSYYIYGNGSWGGFGSGFPFYNGTGSIWA